MSKGIDHFFRVQFLLVYLIGSIPRLVHIFALFPLFMTS